jgi:hypothetical protein
MASVVKRLWFCSLKFNLAAYMALCLSVSFVWPQKVHYNKMIFPYQYVTVNEAQFLLWNQGQTSNYLKVKFWIKQSFVGRESGWDCGICSNLDFRAINSVDQTVSFHTQSWYHMHHVHTAKLQAIVQLTNNSCGQTINWMFWRSKPWQAHTHTHTHTN